MDGIPISKFTLEVHRFKHVAAIPTLVRLMPGAFSAVPEDAAARGTAGLTLESADACALAAYRMPRTAG